MATKHAGFRQVTLQIPESEYPFFMELANNLQFVKKTEANDMPVNNVVRGNIKAGVEDVRLFKKRKLKTTAAKDFLNNL